MIQEFLAGKKTYIAAAGLALTALAAYAGDGDVKTLVEGLLQALALAGLRAGVEKVEG